MPASRVKLTLANHTRAVVPGPLPFLRRQLRKVLGLLDIVEGAWSITLVDDAAMTALHARSMQLPTTTDVLTFDLSEGEALDLDTVLCVDEARRRAAELGHDLSHELLLYAVHSLLHVRGFDDIKAAEARRMHREEDRLLSLVGVGPVFRKGGAGGRRAIS
jgi:rRNA maturation RNase YbeY